MVTGTIKKETIDISDIFKKIDGFDIYMLYLGKFKPNELINNPLRKDDHASFIVGTKTGKWTHFDFADAYWRGGPIDLVKQIYNCDLPTALSIIDRDFKLGLADGTVSNVKEVVVWQKASIEEIKAPFIQVVTRKFNREELAYWNSYYLDREDLKRGEVYAIHELFSNRKKVNSSELRFAYYYPSIDRWKIYQPNCDTKSRMISKRKWHTNVPFDYCDSLENISECEYSYLTKSRKDRLVLTKALNVNCVADVQSENPSCISENTIFHLKMKSKKQVTIFDSDEAGKASSMWLTKEHGFLHINVPDKYKAQNIKDFSDYAKAFGLEAIRNYFIKKNRI